MPHPLTAALEERGYGFIDGFLSEEEAMAVFKETEDMVMVDGEVSGEAGYWVTERKVERRGDVVAWKGVEEVGGAMKVLTEKLQGVVNTMRTDGLRRLEEVETAKGGKVELERIMIAKYLEPGRRFVPHIDNPNNNGRLLTFTYYVSPSMTPDTQGGALRIHKSITGPPIEDIAPAFNRLACLYSDSTVHEVAPVENPPRVTVVAWFSVQSQEEKKEAMREIFRLLMKGRK